MLSRIIFSMTFMVFVILSSYMAHEDEYLKSSLILGISCLYFFPVFIFERTVDFFRGITQGASTALLEYQFLPNMISLAILAYPNYPVWSLFLFPVLIGMGVISIINLVKIYTKTKGD